MLYRALKTNIIRLGSKESKDFDAQSGVVFVPQSDSKIFLHWLTDSGKLRQTYTMTYPTRVEGTVRVINALEKSTQIQVIHLD